MLKIAIAASVLIVAPAHAQTKAVGADLLPVEVAYKELASGQTGLAIRKLEDHEGIAANDPSRLINLASAYARLGQNERASQLYKAAMRSDSFYEVQLANGQWKGRRQTILEQLPFGPKDHPRIHKPHF